MLSLCYRSLAIYVNEDNLQGLQSFLENKQVQVDDRDENGATCLMLAACKGKVAFVRELLSHGADPNAEDADLWSALLCAAKEGYADVCHELLEHGANIEHKDVGAWTALMWATYKERTDVVVLLLEKKADVNAYGNYHISSLLWAAGRGYTTIAQHLISHGAKVNVGDKYGTTALVWACRKGYTEIVDSLLNAGANVETAGMYSWTPLLVATHGNHVDVVNLLLEHKPNVNALDKDGCSSLTIACKEGYYEIATALMNSGAYINIQDRAGDTNLIHAVKGGHRSVVEALLKKYADVDICGKDRKTALYVAVEKCNTSILKMLLNANPDVEISTKDGDTPFLRAVRSRNAEMVQLLLDKKAKITAVDKKGDTALHIAMRARSKHIVEILLRNPKHGHILYKPNRAGETPYNIDFGHQKTLIGQIYGARRINTNEDNENMLGYDLYSSTVADILSEPSLSMPITVGLYAKWGSGKSFLLNKLKDEMKNFTREWVEPVFCFSEFLFLIIVHIATIVGVVLGLCFQNWIIGLSTGIVSVILAYVFFISLWYATKRCDSYRIYILNMKITRKLNNIKLVLQIMFCHPPQSSSNDGMSVHPIKFYFTDHTRVSTTIAGENSVVQMIGSLYDAIEKDYGSVATRLYRAFRPKPGKTKSWTWRKFCCLPYIVVFEIAFICLLLGVCALTTFLLYYNSIYEVHPTDVLTLHVIMIVSALLIGIAAVANLYTWNKMFASLLFSQRRQLQRTIAKLDTLKSEGFLQALRHEVVLMKDMVKCLDSLTSQQKRLVIIVDGLDSCEQDKVLLVLDAVHLLFSDANCPFVIILAIDPHVIAKAVEINSRRVFNESNIGGHSYLNNMVHLPFYLQNSGLRKVKVAQQTAVAHRKLTGTTWNDVDDNVNMAGNSLLVRSLSSRRLSSESALMSSQEKLKFGVRKGSRKLKLSESIASSIASNLNKAVGPQDLTKMLLTDDYFSDVNPRSMRRLMNVVCVIGRLMNSFQIEFNWYRLASWINITEQWPFRTSWIIHHYDMHEDSLEDSTPLKSLYEKVRPLIPSLKDVEPLLELDRDERKFEIFLSFHRSSLLISDLKIFLPFTINLDPYLKKVIKEETQAMDEEGIIMNPIRNSFVSSRNIGGMGWNNMPEWSSPPGSVIDTNKRTKAFMRQAMPPTAVVYPSTAGLMNWSWSESIPQHSYPLGPITELSPEVLEYKLSTLTVDGVCKLLNKIEDLDTSSINKYKKVIRENNINGRVLLRCDLDELKTLLNMSFGDWEMFRVMIVSLREHEMTTVMKQNEIKHLKTAVGKQQNSIPVRERKASIPKTNSSLGDKDKTQVDGNVALSKKHSVIEKQVTLEDQMICGALQTLNEEACEDVLEETEINDMKQTEVEIPLTSIIPPSPENYQDVKNIRSRANSSAGIGETDFVLLQSSPGYMHWQPVSISIQGNSENLSDSSPRESPQPPSPVSSRQRKVNLISLNKERRHSKHAFNMEESIKWERPRTLSLSNENKYIRSRAKSIDVVPKRFSRTKVDFVKLKDQVFQSSDNIDDSDTESTPLVSQISTPVTSPEYKSSATSPIPFLKHYSSEKSMEEGVNLVLLSPTKSLNSGNVIDGTHLHNNIPSTSLYRESHNKYQTMSECADELVFNMFERTNKADSNSSLFSKYSLSCGQLDRQRSFDVEDISDVHCDTESNV